MISLPGTATSDLRFGRIMLLLLVPAAAFSADCRVREMVGGSGESGTQVLLDPELCPGLSRREGAEVVDFDPALGEQAPFAKLAWVGIADEGLILEVLETHRPVRLNQKVVYRHDFRPDPILRAGSLSAPQFTLRHHGFGSERTRQILWEDHPTGIGSASFHQFSKLLMPTQAPAGSRVPAEIEYLAAQSVPVVSLPVHLRIELCRPDGRPVATLAERAWQIAGGGGRGKFRGHLEIPEDLPPDRYEMRFLFGSPEDPKPIETRPFLVVPPEESSTTGWN